MIVYNLTIYDLLFKFADFLFHANLAKDAKFSFIAEFGLTDLTNLTDSASLRPRLSAVPSVCSRMANASATMRFS